jgi:hypothetical protein
MEVGQETTMTRYRLIVWEGPQGAVPYIAWEQNGRVRCFLPPEGFDTDLPWVRLEDMSLAHEFFRPWRVSGEVRLSNIFLDERSPEELSGSDLIDLLLAKWEQPEAVLA